MKTIYTLFILIIPLIGKGQCFYCEDFESVTAPNLPSEVSTSTLEQNYYTISNSEQIQVSGFYTGTSDDANAGGYWPVGEHGQFAMTSDDACRPGGVIPTINNNCDLGFETLTLPELDFTGQFDLYLKFEYYHDQNYGGGDANVEVSIDGGVTFTDISGPLPNLEAWQQGIFSLSDYNDQDSIVIRFVWSDAGSWSTGFAVDDIEINELQDNSLSMPLFNQWLAGYDGFASSYSQIPLSMIPNSTGIIFQSYVFNNGNFAQDSIRLHASATGFTSQSTAVNLESLEQDTLQCSERFQPTSTGTYQLDFYLMSDSVTTATKSKSIEITDYIYARDDNEMDAVNSLLPSGDGISSWERGTIYDIYENNTLYAIDVYIHNSTTANAKIQGKIYLYQEDQALFLEETNLLPVTASDGWQSIIFANPVSLDAESQYLITVGGDGSAFNDTLRIGSSGSVQSSYGYIVYNGWVNSNGFTATDGTTGSTPMVRMNMNPNLLIYGCLDENAFNYDANANSDDGSCVPIINGCTDPNAFNYDFNANTDDGSCIPFIYGCTDTDAINYYPGSNADDGSCIYLGCTDPNAFNYDANANSDDGSCVPIINGCTDPNAFNYDVNANTDDGSCNYCSNDTIINLISSCESYEWNGEVYSQGGEYIFVTSGSNGCDSITTLNLTIINQINVNIDVTSCDEYLWQGEVYTESGTYTYETVSANGCDSLINLNLSIVGGLESQTIIGQDEVEPFSSYIYALTLNGNSYNWSVTNGSILSDNGNNIEVFWGEAGIGLIEVVETDANGCTITHSLQVNLGNNVENSWNCINDACVDPMDGTGIYGSLEECEANCSSVEPTWDCNNDYACVELSDGSGNFQSLEECEANCNPIADSWNCVNDACVDPMDGTGIYGSLEECESNCNIIEVTFDCISAGICMEVMDSTGEFSSIDDCLTNCNPIADSWNCVQDACVDPLDGSGEFSTLNDCEQVCQNISSISENLIDVNIYPNPSSNIFNLEFNSDSETEISVANVLGEQVYFESVQSVGEFNTQIDLSNYSKGIYNLTIKTSDGLSNHKLILQ